MGGISNEVTKEMFGDVRDRIIIALDVHNSEEAIGIVDNLKELCRQFKVGPVLLYRCGFGIVDRLNDAGASVFLDVKLHDIPNTVHDAVTALAHQNVWALTVHASGGAEMISACVRGARAGAQQSGKVSPRIWAVTLLTSISEVALREELHINISPHRYVLHLSQLARNAGADGVVASGEEIEIIRDACGHEFTIVVPGIRPIWATLGDQKRIITPSEALKRGADYLVIGRPVIRASNRCNALMRILDELTTAV